MKKKSVLALALLLGLSGCGKAPAEPVATPAPTAAATAAPTPSPEPTATPAPTPTASPAPGKVLDYEQIVPVAEIDMTPAALKNGCFTVYKNGGWGFMAADGTELLPCLADVPVFDCGAHLHWNVWLEEAELEPYQNAVEAAGFVLGYGHGAVNRRFVYDLDSNGLFLYAGIEGGGEWSEVDGPTAAACGSLLPVYYCRKQEDEGMTFIGEVEGCGYLNWEKGTAVACELQGVTQVGWYGPEALAPVCTERGWAYVDRSGSPCTETVYGPVLYGEPWSGEPTEAAPLRGGYACVNRGGLWGLLDGSGTEAVPCIYEGCAWDGKTLWVRENGLWTQKLL